MIIFGDGQDAGIYYDGSDLIFDSQLVGGGDFYFKNGDVGIATNSPLGRLDISYSGYTIWVGADEGSVITRTDNTTKRSHYFASQYDIDADGVAVISTLCNSTQNMLLIGGRGAMAGNAPTHMHFYTSANTLGGAGSAAMSIYNDGGVYLWRTKSGATQAGAGASAGEIWETSGHASLPDHVLMLGV